METKNKQKVTINIWVRDAGAYICDANSAEEAMLNEVKRLGREEYDTLLDGLISSFARDGYALDTSDYNHLALAMTLAMRDHLCVDFDFAQKLNLFDVIDPECLNYNTKVGGILLDLMVFSNLIFIVTKKRWVSKNELNIWLEALDDDEEFEVLTKLVSGEFHV